MRIECRWGDHDRPPSEHSELNEDGQFDGEESNLDDDEEVTFGLPPYTLNPEPG